MGLRRIMSEFVIRVISVICSIRSKRKLMETCSF